MLNAFDTGISRLCNISLIRFSLYRVIVSREIVDLIEKQQKDRMHPIERAFKALL